MIETLMALWNRGVRGRLAVMAVTFFCLCISISLLFVTVGGVWGSLLARGRPGGEEAPVSNAVLVTATVPSSVVDPATVGVTPTPILVPNPCLASPTGAHANTVRASATATSGQRDVPTRIATFPPQHKTPTPGATVLPEPVPTLSPTAPAVTATVQPTPTATTPPTNTPTSTPTLVIPTATTTPGTTPTPTSTVPGSTPTVGIVSTAVPTPSVAAVTTPTATAPVSSPTVTISATGGISSRQVHDGRPPIVDTTVARNNGQPGDGNCLGDALVTDGKGSLFSRLQSFFWIILGSSLLGTSLFCAQMYRLSRRSHGQGF